MRNCFSAIQSYEYEGIHGKPADEVVHEEKVITYKIVDSEVNGNGKTVKSEEYSAEEYFEKYPEDRELLEGLEKAFSLYVKYYVNGQRIDANGYYACRVYLVDDKWYVNNGLGVNLAVDFDFLHRLVSIIIPFKDEFNLSGKKLRDTQNHNATDKTV